jgi:uncharacterized protein YceK
MRKLSCTLMVCLLLAGCNGIRGPSAVSLLWTDRPPASATPRRQHKVRKSRGRPNRWMSGWGSSRYARKHAQGGSEDRQMTSGSRRVLCLLAVCLLSAGCHMMAEPSHQPIDGLRLFPTRMSSKADRKLKRQVANDPFPEAGDVNLRVCVSQ